MVVGFCFVAALVGTGALRPTELLSSVNSVKTNGPISGHNGMVLSVGSHNEPRPRWAACCDRRFALAIRGLPPRGRSPIEPTRAVPNTIKRARAAVRERPSELVVTTVYVCVCKCVCAWVVVGRCWMPQGVIPGYHVDNIQNMGAHDVRMWNRAARGACQIDLLEGRTVFGSDLEVESCLFPPPLLWLPAAGPAYREAWQRVALAAMLQRAVAAIRSVDVLAASPACVRPAFAAFSPLIRGAFSRGEMSGRARHISARRRAPIGIARNCHAGVRARCRRALGRAGGGAVARAA